MTQRQSSHAITVLPVIEWRKRKRKENEKEPEQEQELEQERERSPLSSLFQNPLVD
jgi:hypothetical protein